MLTPEDFLSVTQFHIVTDGSPFDIAVENLDAEFLQLFAEEPWQRTRHAPMSGVFLSTASGNTQILYPLKVTRTFQSKGPPKARIESPHKAEPGKP